MRVGGAATITITITIGRTITIVSSVVCRTGGVGIRIAHATTLATTLTLLVLFASLLSFPVTERVRLTHAPRRRG